MYVTSLSVHPLMDWWTQLVSISWLLQIMLQWTGECRYFFQVLFSFPLDLYPEVRLLDHMVVLVLIFQGTSVLFFIVNVPYCIPTNSGNAFPLPHILTNRCYLLSFGDSHSNRWIISHVKHLFMCPLAFVCPFCKNVHLVSQLMFNWTICFFCNCVLWVLYVFWILTPYQTYNGRHNSHSVGCLFVLLMVSFAAFKLDILSPIYFWFCSLYFWFKIPQITDKKTIKALGS